MRTTRSNSSPARREELKRKLEEHRSGNISAEEFEKLSAERKDIEKELALRTKRRDELTAAADKKQKSRRRERNYERQPFAFQGWHGECGYSRDGRVPQRILQAAAEEKPLEDLEKRAMTSASTSAGAAIPTQTMDMIIGQLRESDSLLGLITLTNIPSLTSFPVENVVNDAAWVSEGSDSTPSNDTLKAVSLAAYTLIKTIKITAQVARMSIDAFETWLVNALVRKLRAACDKAIISGTGTNQPTGLDTLTWNATNSVTVAKAATVTYDNLVDLKRSSEKVSSITLFGRAIANEGDALKAQRRPEAPALRACGSRMLRRDAARVSRPPGCKREGRRDVLRGLEIGVCHELRAAHRDRKLRRGGFHERIRRLSRYGACRRQAHGRCGRARQAGTGNV